MPPKHEHPTGSMNTQSEPEISANQIRQIAALCHIGLTDDEVEELRVEMAKLVSEVSVLQRIDTIGVEPTGHAVGDVHTVMRDDAPRPPLDREDVLANAPRRDGNYFRVRAIMEES